MDITHTKVTNARNRVQLPVTYFLVCEDLCNCGAAQQGTPCKATSAARQHAPASPAGLPGRGAVQLGGWPAPPHALPASTHC